MKKILHFLGELNPILFAFLYFLFAFLATTLIYYFPIFELKTSLENTDLKSFSTSLYFSFTTITTLGYGDITPGNEATRFLVVFLAFIGILITGLFLNSLAYRVSLITQEKDKQIFEKETKEKEIQKYKNIHPIIIQDVDDFLHTTYQLVTVSKERKPNADFNILMKLKFKLNDLQDLHKRINLRKYNFYQTNIEAFYQVYDKLNKDIEDFLKLGYFSFDQDLTEKIAGYLSLSKAIDSRVHILNILQDENEKENVREMLINAAEAVEITEIPNAIDPYILLYKQINEVVTIIKEIDQRVPIFKS